MKLNIIKKIILPALLMMITSSAMSQDMIDEDFLDNIEENAKALWTENTPAFANNTVPDKYKDESAVIFGFKRSVTIDKKSRMGFLSKGERSLLFFENVHFKIKLNDRNAVKAFTEVYFRYSDKVDGVSAKIIKPDGLVQPVLLDDAIGVESVSNVPEFFKSFFDQQSGSERRYFKVAVPDLEPGDILEYVATTKSKLNVSGMGYIEFSPQYELCNKVYPVLYNQIIMETDGKSFFKSLSMNGAPDFKKEAASDDEFFRYVFTDTDRGVEKDVNFINTYKVMPLTKFQVIYANNEKTKGALIGEKGEIKTGFSKEELAKKAWEEYEKTGREYYGNYATVDNVVNMLWTELKKKETNGWEEYIGNVYYRVRNLVLNRDTYLSDKTAAYIFAALMDKKYIKADIVISVSNSVGKMDNILFDNEVRYICRVNNKFYFNWTDYSNPGELVENLLASEAYIIRAPGKKGAQEIIPITLPDASSDDNVVEYAVNAQLDKEMNTLAVSRKSTYRGLSKTRNISTALKYTPYMLDDYKNYGGESPTENMRSAQEEEYNKSVKALKDNFKEAKPEYVKNNLQSEFDQKVKYKNFTINSDGRTVKQNDLVFVEDFELNGMLRKAGKKYLVNIPGLVGGQLQIKKEERIRKYDINVGCARSLSWKIKFKVPDNYTVEGLQELNTNVDNESGSFSCTAEEKEGVVFINIKKVYKKANVAKDKWPEMLAFIDAAYDNSFRYLLLKPKN